MPPFWMKRSFWMGSGIAAALAVSHIVAYEVGDIRAHEMAEARVAGIQRTAQEQIDDLKAQLIWMSHRYFTSKRACPIPPPEESETGERAT